MGNSVSSSLAGCLVPITAQHSHQHSYPYLCNPSDEGLGHSFCYIRPIPESPVHLSPTSSHPSIQDDPPSTNHIQGNLTDVSDTSKSIPETTFRSISGASVSANTSTPCTIACNEQPSFFAKVPNDQAAAFESTPSFTALPLQPIPKGSNSATFSGPISSSFERGLMFGPFERGFMSGPLERSSMSGPMESSFDHTYFSAPLPGYSRNYTKKRRKTIARFLSTVSKPVKAVLNGTAWKKSILRDHSTCDSVYAAHHLDSRNLQWAQGKAGEDRVHVVLSERHGWLFVGIYDGFNGPDAPDFLMRNLYPAIYKELQGLLWGEDEVPAHWRGKPDVGRETKTSPYMNREAESFKANGSHNDCCFFKSSRLAQPQTKGVDAQHNAILRHKIGVSIPDGFSDKGFKSKTSAFMDGHTETKEIDSALPCKDEWECAGQKAWPVKDQKPYKKNDIDHSAVLRALAQALEDTEEAYLDMANQALDENPELALMGSCILVMLMKDEDVYIMNVGDSRAIIAQQRSRPLQSTHSSKTSNIDDKIGLRDSMLRLDLERIIEETPTELEALEGPRDIHCYKKCQSNALQLSSDHNTSIEEEICRIRAEHPDDKFSILNDRVKGTLKVTRAFGAGFLKKPQWNNAILETFRIDYVGSAPYISCTPALHHHRLCPNDRFLILSSDGLYQYLTNEEVVYEVESFMERFPEGDPAQHLIEEVLFRAAKKAGMDFHELLDIPQGDRRKYHDDVSVMVISLEGRIWRSSS